VNLLVAILAVAALSASARGQSPDSSLVDGPPAASRVAQPDTSSRVPAADAAARAEAAPASESSPAGTPGAHTSRNDAADSAQSGDAAPAMADYQIELPAGVLFGAFTRDDGPFLIAGSVIVPAGQTLEFGPGCTVYVGGEYSTITVFGQLIARGTKQEPVRFVSANATPNPWDWDRIYCRSRARSVFEHCIVKHSNYGLFVENGSASVRNSSFERNSLHGLVVKNSDVSLKNVRFSAGHVLALNCLPGAVVRAESLSVTHNITGAACADGARLTVRGGTIAKNRTGLAVKSGASVEIVAADLTKNKLGLASEREIPKKMRQMVYGNVVDAKTVAAEEMTALLKPPEAVKSIVLPTAASTRQPDPGFEQGFSALHAPRPPAASFIGNVEAGLAYYQPKSIRHPVQDTLIRQTRYLGEQSEEWYGRLQPEINVFMQGRGGEADVNVNADLYGNEWVDNQTHLRKNMFTMAMNYSSQNLVLGDFFENASEISISGRKMTGVKYTGSFMDMGRGEDRFEFKLAAGESETPKDSGDHEINVFGDTVDTGFSVRQQLTYMSSLTYKPTRYSSITARGIIARDQINKTLFGRSISDPAAPRPIEAQTGTIAGAVVFLDGRMAVNAEINLGAEDTVDSADYDKVAWYNPKVSKAVPRVFGLLDPDSAHFAAAAGVSGEFGGYDIGVSITEIGERYFSAGNPYLENDRRIAALTASRQFLERLQTDAAYAYERTGVHDTLTLSAPSSSPVDKHSLALGGEYPFGEGKPTAEAEYEIEYQFSRESDQDTLAATGYGLTRNRELAHTALAGVKQRFDNGLDYNVKYRLIRENDYSSYVEAAKQDVGDAWFHEIGLRLGTRIARRVRNRASFSVKYKHEHQDSLRGFGFKFSDNLRLTVIPRKLSLELKGDYQHKTEREFDDDTGAWEQPVLYRLYGAGGGVKYSLTSRIAASIRAQYEKVHDENEGAENYRVIFGGLYFTYLF
jgi:hypothetical protein